MTTSYIEFLTDFIVTMSFMYSFTHWLIYNLSMYIYKEIQSHRILLAIVYASVSSYDDKLQSLETEPM